MTPRASICFPEASGQAVGSLQVDSPGAQTLAEVLPVDTRPTALGLGLTNARAPDVSSANWTLPPLG